MMEHMASDSRDVPPAVLDDDIDLGRFVVGDEDGPFGILTSLQDFAGAFRHFLDPALQGQARAKLRGDLAGLVCEYLTGQQALAAEVEAILRGEAARLENVALAAGLTPPVEPTPDLEWLYAEFSRIPLVLLQMISLVQTRRDDAWRYAMEREQTALDLEDEDDELEEPEDHEQDPD